MKIHRKACAVYNEAVVASDASGNFRRDAEFLRLKKRAFESKLRADARFRGVRISAIIGGSILTLFLPIYFTLEAGRREAESERIAQEEILWKENSLEFTNSLGMRFVSVPGLSSVLFCEHETRVKDYETFTPTSSKGEENPYPMVNVTWEEANAFCAWLSRKEGRNYRLPTQSEWLVALADDYSGEVWRAYLKPVKGSYSKNSNGLYDMAWSVTEWCGDGKYSAIGGSYKKAMYSLLGEQYAKKEIDYYEGGRSEYIGFRLVVDVDR